MGVQGSIRRPVGSLALAPVTDRLWVTRREPVWREDVDAAAGLAAVTAVEERVRHGLPPVSVVSVTGLALRPQEQQAASASTIGAPRAGRQAAWAVSGFLAVAAA